MKKNLFGLGIKSTSENLIFRRIYKFGDFIVAFLSYLLHKLDSFFFYLHLLTVRNIELFINLKFRAASSLVWSRGRLVKKYRYLFIVVLSFVLFFSGGVFQGRFVEPRSSQGSTFLSSNFVFYQKATAATSKGEKTLLDQPVEHVVIEGESLASISQSYNISLESVKFANDLTSNTVEPGQILKIPPVEGTLHTVQPGDTLEKLSKRYNVPTQTIVDFNYIDSPYVLEQGQVITIPNAQAPQASKYYAGATAGYDLSAYGVIPYSGDVKEKGSGNFSWPFSGVLTQFFSAYHPGLDIAAHTGDILAADKGKVIRAGWWQGGYGNAVQVDHGNGYVTTYAHMSVIAVSTGEEVDKGQKLGVVGSTGRSTGPHLHFTVQLSGKYLNPLSVLP